MELIPTADNDLLHQPHLQRANGVEAINEIVGIPVRGGVAQRTERIKRLDRFLGFLGAIHALWFVDDNDGFCRLNELDGLPPLQTIRLLVDDVGLSFRVCTRKIFPERVDVDDEYLNRVADRKLAELGNPFRVVNKMLELDVAIERTEMFGSDFDIL